MKSLFPLLLLLASTAQATLKVAVVDTGLDLTDPRFIGHLCKEGHKDFSGTGIADVNGHGTHVAGLIVENAKDSDYCLVIYKYWTDYTTNSMEPYLQALQQAIEAKVDIVNLSVATEGFDETEKSLICTLGNQANIQFVAAAGNYGKDLADFPLYPAALGCGNILVVGGRGFSGSATGRLVGYKEQARAVVSTLPNGAKGPMTGTSMSTAIHTGKLIYERSH